MQTQAVVKATKQHKPTIPNRIDKVKLAELAKTDLTNREIAKILDVHEVSLCRALKRYNLQREAINDLDEHIRPVLRGLQEKYINALLTKDLQKESAAVLHTGLGIIEDKLNAGGGRNNGVNIQVNVRVDPSQPTNEQITISHDGSNAGDNNA